MNLTQEQQIILDKAIDNIYISAAPGSGKSTVLSLICDKLLKDTNNYVCLVTFTNKAAKSIINKCQSLDKNRILGGTFHSIAYRAMKEQGYKYAICDENKKRLIIKRIFNCKKDKDKYEGLYEHISKAKAAWPRETDLAVEKYNKELEKYNLIDFDDIIYNFIDLVSSSKLTLPKITFGLVDELQDTSGPQLEMLKAIQNQTKCKMIGVADDDQSIYKWRGARPENVLDFISIFKCEILNMGYNFRSATRIVESSKLLIEHNKTRIQKLIRPFKENKGIVFSKSFDNHFKEIDYVVARCQTDHDKKIAILYRNRLHKHYLEFELRKAKVNYQVNDMLDITDRTPIKVIFSCLKLASSKFDIYDLEQTAKALKGIGLGTVKKMTDRISETATITAILDSDMANPKKNKRLSSIISLRSKFVSLNDQPLSLLVLEIEKLFTPSFEVSKDIREFILDITGDYKTNSESIRDLCNELGLNNKEDSSTKDARVELSTVHGYKGLEREIVILPFAHQYMQAMPGKVLDEEDERRLFYVAVTRAQERLFITYTGDKPQFVSEMKI